MAVPRCLNANQPNDVDAAETTVINGIEYQVIYLTDNNDDNKAQILAHNENRDLNYRYVLTADWVCIRPSSSSFQVFGKSVIWDLNGYTWTLSYGYIDFEPNSLEIADSSATQTGTIVCDTGNVTFKTWYPCEKVIISGGNCAAARIVLYGFVPPVTFLGGNYTPATGHAVIENGYPDKYDLHVTLAPWMMTDTDGSIKPKADCEYCLSTSALVSGVYNYQYAYQWNIPARKMAHLTVPKDRIYYLWERLSGGTYQYTNYRYVNGTW